MQVTSFSPSFIGKTEQFFVLRNEGLTNPAIPRMYARYSTVKAYDNRAEVPVYVSAEDALSDFLADVPIYVESLTTTPPAYPADRDDTDYGLTPARNLWASRFASAKASRHAA